MFEFLDVTIWLQWFLWWWMLLKLRLETTLAFTYSYDIDCLKQSTFRIGKIDWKSGRAPVFEQMRIVSWQEGIWS